MTTTDTRSTVLYEAAAMEAMRDTLRLAEARITKWAYDAPSNGDALSLGRLAEALDAAETAVFNALNLASSHCGCDESKDAIDAGLARSAASRAS